MIRSRVGYTLLLYLMLPYVLLRLWWRGRRERAYRSHIAERFGHYSAPAPGGCIWVHAVSVGETRATQPIVERLLERPHGVDGYRTKFAIEILHFALPHAVLAGAGAVHGERSLDETPQQRFGAGDFACVVHVDEKAQVEIAVADVADDG